MREAHLKSEFSLSGQAWCALGGRGGTALGEMHNSHTSVSTLSLPSIAFHIFIRRLPYRAAIEKETSSQPLFTYSLASLPLE